jgi:hypothetical protein
MIFYALTLTFLAFWKPLWSVLAILTLVGAVAAFAMLAWGAGLFAPGVDYSSPEVISVVRAIIPSVVLNASIYIALGALIVIWGKNRREADARQLELLARLTQPQKLD